MAWTDRSLKRRLIIAIVEIGAVGNYIARCVGASHGDSFDIRDSTVSN